jgi:hypothetical protein
MLEPHISLIRGKRMGETGVSKLEERPATQQAPAGVDSGYVARNQHAS